MSLPPIGTTPQVQAANQSVAATSSASGGITFVGPSGIQGSTITVVATIPNAPAIAIFTATLGTVGGQGVVVDTFAGDSTAGKFQIGVGQTLVITGSGLTPNTLYTCTFGTVTDVGAVQVMIPEPNTSALVAQIFSQGGVDTLLSGFVTDGGGGSLLISGLTIRSYQTILVQLKSGLAGGSFTVTVSLPPLADAFQTLTGPTGTGGLEAVLPYANQPGDTWKILLVGSAGRTYGVTVLGLTNAEVLQVVGNPSNPLDVVNYGGLGTATVNILSGGNGNILGPPTTGFAYRLHGFMSEVNAAAGTAILLATSGARPVYGAISFNSPYCPLHGQLVTTGLSVNNAMGLTQAFDITYDVVTLPSIT